MKPRALTQLSPLRHPVRLAVITSACLVYLAAGASCSLLWARPPEGPHPPPPPQLRSRQPGADRPAMPGPPHQPSMRPWGQWANSEASTLLEEANISIPDASAQPTAVVRFLLDIQRLRERVNEDLATLQERSRESLERDRGRRQPNPVWRPLRGADESEDAQQRLHRLAIDIRQREWLLRAMAWTAYQNRESWRRAIDTLEQTQQSEVSRSHLTQAREILEQIEQRLGTVETFMNERDTERGPGRWRNRPFRELGPNDERPDRRGAAGAPAGPGAQGGPGARPILSESLLLELEFRAQLDRQAEVIRQQQRAIEHLQQRLDDLERRLPAPVFEAP